MRAMTMGFDGREPGDNPALDIIESLRTELAACREANNQWHDGYVKRHNDALHYAEQIHKLREALEPFAADAVKYDPPEGDDDDLAWDTDFTVGDLRRARAVLSETGGGDE